MGKKGAKIGKAKRNFKKFFPKGFELTDPKCQHIDIVFYDDKRSKTKNSRIHKEIKNLEKYFQEGIQKRAKKLFKMEECY